MAKIVREEQLVNVVVYSTEDGRLFRVELYIINTPVGIGTWRTNHVGRVYHQIPVGAVISTGGKPAKLPMTWAIFEPLSGIEETTPEAILEKVKTGISERPVKA